MPCSDARQRLDLKNGDVVDVGDVASGDLLKRVGDEVQGVAASGFASSSHTHAASVITVTPSGGIAATNAQAALEELDAEKAAASHTHSAADITSGTLDGDRLPGLSTTKRGGAPATGTPSGKYLKDDGTWDAPTATGDLFSTIVSKTGNYTIVSPTDNGTTYDCDSSGGAFTMTLPTAPAAGFRVAIMRRAGTPGANTVTVAAGGADVIRGPRSTAATSFALQLYESVVLTYYATAGVWMAVAHSSTADAGTSIASLRTIGTGGTQACAGNDSRLSDSRAPTGSAGGELAGSYPNPTLSDEVWTAILLGV